MLHKDLLYRKEVIERIRKGNFQECPICEEDVDNLALTACGCLFCVECLRKVMSIGKGCPICLFQLSSDDFYLLNTEEIAIDLSGYKQSSKTKAIIEKVMMIKDKKEKVVIFTQFLPMIKFLEREFQENHVKYCVNDIINIITNFFSSKFKREKNKDKEKIIEKIDLF